MATFTRGHFKRIAAMLQNVKPIRSGQSDGEKLYDAGRERQWTITVDWFASEFRILNPDFDVDKFKGMCGLGTGPETGCKFCDSPDAAPVAIEDGKRVHRYPHGTVDCTRK